MQTIRGEEDAAKLERVLQLLQQKGAEQLCCADRLSKVLALVAEVYACVQIASICPICV